MIGEEKTNTVAKQFAWDQDVQCLSGVGAKFAQKLAKLRLHTTGDLLLHAPYRYQDRTRLTPINDLLHEQYAVVQGEITRVSTQGFGKKSRLIVMISDGTNQIELAFFHYYPNQASAFVPKKIVRAFGQVQWFRNKFSMVHPEYEIFHPTKIAPLTPYLTPIYHTVKGVSQKWLQKNIKLVLTEFMQSNQQDPLLAHIGQENLLDFKQAIKLIHQPTPDIDCQSLSERRHPAYYRLIIEELLTHRFALSKIKQETAQKQSIAFKLKSSTLEDFKNSLPFSLTSAQQKVLAEIQADLSQTTPMLRLVQGDVGAGKTMIAILAALIVAKQDYQVAVMAPTEILAQQLLENFQLFLDKFSIRCELLTGKLKAKARRSALENIALGLTKVAIGTHALFQTDVVFQKLGLIIVDEQHRFGVHQRFSLHAKSDSAIEQTWAHQLIMTATPIPRTLAMSHYSHLDISVIDSLPPNRKPIETIVLPQSRKHEVCKKIMQLCAAGQQVYWVCTLIEESDTLTMTAAQDAVEYLRQQCPDIRVELVHGKMPGDDKQLVMDSFKNGDIAVLVATTVIEVGVNVPNATLMVIENPERLGLAQLHQLRGRVGRGELASHCLLLYGLPLSNFAKQRLKTLKETNDGFKISEADLDLRGPGEVLGSRQTGIVQFKVADFSRDKRFFEKLTSWEESLADLAIEEKQAMYQRWLGDKSQYINT